MGPFEVASEKIIQFRSKVILSNISGFFFVCFFQKYSVLDLYFVLFFASECETACVLDYGHVNEE